MYMCVCVCVCLRVRACVRVGACGCMHAVKPACPGVVEGELQDTLDKGTYRCESTQ